MFNWENIIPLRLHSILGLRLWFIVVNKRSRERRQSKTDPGLGKQVVGVAQKVERDQYVGTGSVDLNSSGLWWAANFK